MDEVLVKFEWPMPHQWGIGMRPHHFAHLHDQDHLPVLEVLADNFFYNNGGPSWWHAEKLVERTNCVMHSVGLNIVGQDPLSEDYLCRMKKTALRLKPKVISDHLCLTKHDNVQFYDLMPFAYTEQNLKHVASRVSKAQDYLQHEIALENLSAYVGFTHSEMTEIDFMIELCRQTGCKMLLDVNNLFVSSQNLKFNGYDELGKIPSQHVAQIHLSGHSETTIEGEKFLHDTHDEKICYDVWNIAKKAFNLFTSAPVILERDDEAVTLETLHAELTKGVQIFYDRPTTSIQPATLRTHTSNQTPSQHFRATSFWKVSQYPFGNSPRTYEPCDWR